jgi:signal transduction histidine kinase
VVSQVSTITASNLNQRLNAGNGNDEISQLATTFNLMLDRLEKAFMIQKSFVSNASHELRTPLAAINSQIEVALMKKREPGEYETVLNSLLDDARGLTSLANNLLEIARSEQDIRSLSIKPVRLDELLLQTQSEFQVLHPENLVDTVILDETENEDQELSLYGNENLLKLIFINLIDNAMKFSSGRPVKVSLIFKSDSVHIMVEDKGIGISPEELQLIREPFYRASNAVHMHGHGIGLSLIAKIVKLHEGIMEINSQLNEGTTVSITLPYKMKNNGTD